MRRLALVMAVALASGRADALGLGDIELHSALNEPLNAEVRLITDKPGEAAKASILLAPNSEFERAGVERSADLSNLKFDIVTDKSGASKVKITSTKPIREPFLDFVVQLRWPEGKLLREYTVLLDPPVFGEEKQAAPVSAPETAAPAAAKSAAPAVVPVPTPAMSKPAPAAAPTMAAPTHPTPAPRESKRHVAPPAAPMAEKKPVAGASSYGPTRRNDTLWNIANNLRPDDSVTVYQMMMALLKSNPQAFFNNNVNDLKMGYVLRVPDKAVIAAIDQKQAVQESARQYQEWQQRRHGGVVSAPSTSAPAEPSAAKASAEASAKEKESARLRLVAPGDTSGKTVGGVKAELDKLRGDLAMALESSDAAKRESDELRSRVASLEEQINSLQRLLTLKDQALSDMQKRSGLAMPPQAQPQAPAQAQTPAKPAESAPAKPPVAKKPKPAPKPAEPESPDLLANPGLLGAAAGALLLLISVVWLIIRRRRGNSGDEGAEDAPVIEDDTPPVNIEIAEDGSTEATPVVEGMNDAHMDQVAEEVAQQAEQDMPQTANDLEVMKSSEGEIDPIVEADVYLAYRRYQQAEALIQSALEKQPNDQDLLAKLLEIYYASKNAEAFYKTAQSLYINLGSNEEDPVWQRILPMGRELCPDQDIFATPEEPESEPVAETSMMEQSEASLEEASPQESFEAPAVEESQEEKMELDLNIGGEAEAPSESLGSALDLGGPEVQASEEPAAPETTETEELPVEAPAEEEQKANTNWEGESAATDFGSLDFGLDDSDLLAGTDVVGTKLDLARAYIDMGDNESARDILKEVADEGNAQQKQEANDLMANMA